jgi:hypothetical protein
VGQKTGGRLVTQAAATKVYVLQLEKIYDTTGNEVSRPPRDGDLNPEQLMHELEDFLRREQERSAE